MSDLELLAMLYERSIKINDPNKKGKLFELFVKELFKMLPCKIDLFKIKREGGGDIDLVLLFIDDPSKCGLSFIEYKKAIIEAKNWKRPVDESTISSFKDKLKRSDVKVGIVITSSDFTEKCWLPILTALNDGYLILPVNGELINKVLEGRSEITEILNESYKKLLSKA